MRTTLDINVSLLRRAKAEAARRGTTLTRLIEEGLALRLADEASPAGGSKRFRMRVFEGGGGLQPGIDPSSNAQLFAAMNELYDLRQAGVVPFEEPEE